MQKTTIYKEFSFDSAHFLPMVPKDHKCKHMHGHTYKLVVYISGDIDERLGWVIDFSEVKDIVGEVLSIIDHKTLNDIEGLSNPTCELLAKWLWDKIKPKLSGLTKIDLKETPTSGVIYEG